MKYQLKFELNRGKILDSMVKKVIPNFFIYFFKYCNQFFNFKNVFDCNI
jgi:hypothetical protein